MLSNIKHIVIADDDQDDLMLFEEAVEETCLNANLKVATDGIILMNLLEEISKPDRILLDLNIPLKSGKECLVEIRSDNKYNDVPIGILTTSSLKKDIDEYFKKGADYYFVKPKTYDELKRLVESICTGSLK